MSLLNSPKKKLSLLLISSAFIFSGCQRVSDDIEPTISYSVQDKYLLSLPSPFPPLSEVERAQDWGREMQIGFGFAHELDLYQAITKTIREVDTKHMIIIEGNGWGNNYNGFPGTWDPNMVMSFHKYWNPNTQEAISRFLALREKHGLPLWLGESGENNNQWFRECVALVEKNHIGWAWWPYKKVSSSSCILTITRPDNFKKVVDYWNGSGGRPTREIAADGLFELAKNAKAGNCRFNADVANALIPTGSTTQAPAH